MSIFLFLTLRRMTCVNRSKKQWTNGLWWWRRWWWWWNAVIDLTKSPFLFWAFRHGLRHITTLRKEEKKRKNNWSKEKNFLQMIVIIYKFRCKNSRNAHPLTQNVMWVSQNFRFSYRWPSHEIKRFVAINLYKKLHSTHTLTRTRICTRVCAALVRNSEIYSAQHSITMFRLATILPKTWCHWMVQIIVGFISIPAWHITWSTLKDEFHWKWQHQVVLLLIHGTHNIIPHYIRRYAWNFALNLCYKN